MFAFSITPWILYAGVVVLALSTLTMPTVQAMLSANAGEERQGEVQGALTSLQALMLAIGPLVMGSLFALATRPGQAVFFPGAAFLAAALIALVAFFVLWGLHRPARSHATVAEIRATP